MERSLGAIFQPTTGEKQEASLACCRWDPSGPSRAKLVGAAHPPWGWRQRWGWYHQGKGHLIEPDALWFYQMWTPLTDRPGLAGWRCRQVAAGLGNSAVMFQCWWMFSRCCGICLIYFCGRAVSHIPVQGCVMKRTWDNTSVIFFYMCLLFTHVERYWKSCSRYLPRIPALTCSTLENFISKKSAHAPPRSGPSVVHGAALGQH